MSKKKKKKNQVSYKKRNGQKKNRPKEIVSKQNIAPEEEKFNILSDHLSGINKQINDQKNNAKTITQVDSINKNVVLPKSANKKKNTNSKSAKQASEKPIIKSAKEKVVTAKKSKSKVIDDNAIEVDKVNKDDAKVIKVSKKQKKESSNESLTIAENSEDDKAKISFENISRFFTKKVRKNILIGLSVIVLLISGYGLKVYLSFQNAMKNISTGNIPQATVVTDVETEPFNVLFIGLGTNGKDGEETLADSINIFSVNPQNNYAEAIAIPRDSYLPFGASCEWGIGEFDKITHSTGISSECLQTSLTDVFGIEINYYVSVDFMGFIDIVDALGGVEMKVPNLIEEFNAYEDPKLKPELKTGKQWCEHNSKRKRYRVCFDKFGKQTVNGEQALALARSRHYDGDEARNLRQTELIKAIITKATSVSTIFTASEVIEAAGKAVDTNIPSNQFMSFFSLAQKMLSKKTGPDAFAMRTTQLAGFDATMYGERISDQELYYRVVPTTSIYNVSKKMWHSTHDGDVVISPETFDFSVIDKEAEDYTDEVFFKDPYYHDVYREIYTI